MNGAPNHITQATAPLTEDEIQTLLRAATLAPSIHNSQPWAFAVGERHVELYVDTSRQLEAADPSRRSMFISCGAALFNLRVAAEHLGFHVATHLLPDDVDDSLVAAVEFTHRDRWPGRLHVYYAAIPARRTNRHPFSDRRIPSTVLTSLVEAVRLERASVRTFDDPDEISRVVRLLHDAEVAESTDAALADERSSWIGTPRPDDGIPIDALGPHPDAANAAFRDLGRSVSAHSESAEFERTPTLAVLSTTHDEVIDWVRAGQALERLLLEATMAGVSASFLNQPLDQTDLRWLVRSFDSGAGHSQMILRLGFGKQVPATPRRPLDQVRRTARLSSTQFDG
ncbi:MAG TPA: nitroreductase [Actinomycetes bacterium]|nr:nitroreductase [Actinomycetes bacterium]